MLFECGCIIGDQHLPDMGERMITCAHGKWKVRLEKEVTITTVITFIGPNTDYDNTDESGSR